MIERKAENLLNSTDDLIMPLFEGNPAISKVVRNFVTTKKRELVPKIQEQCDLLVETSCMDPDISLIEAVTNAESTLNDYIAQLIGDKLSLPAGTVSISLQTLFGERLFKL